MNSSHKPGLNYSLQFTCRNISKLSKYILHLIKYISLGRDKQSISAVRLK